MNDPTAADRRRQPSIRSGEEVRMWRREAYYIALQDGEPDFRASLSALYSEVMAAFASEVTSRQPPHGPSDVLREDVLEPFVIAHKLPQRPTPEHFQGVGDARARSYRVLTDGAFDLWCVLVNHENPTFDTENAVYPGGPLKPIALRGYQRADNENAIYYGGERDPRTGDLRDGVMTVRPRLPQLYYRAGRTSRAELNKAISAAFAKAQREYLDSADKLDKRAIDLGYERVNAKSLSEDYLRRTGQQLYLRAHTLLSWAQIAIKTGMKRATSDPISARAVQSNVTQWAAELLVDISRTRAK